MSVPYIFPGTPRPPRVSDTAAAPQVSVKSRFGAKQTMCGISLGGNHVAADQWVPQFPPFRAQGLSLAEAQAHWPKLLAVQTHAAQGQKHLPNGSPRHYGALVVLDNGIQAFGTNVEASRQLALCDLRLAIGTAMNQWLAETALKESLPWQDGTHQPNSLPRQVLLPKSLPQFPTVKTIYLANADLKGDKPTPCADCQDWLNSQYFKPETRVISLEKSGDSVMPLVRQRTVRDILPLHKGRKPTRFTTERSLSKLKSVISDSVAEVIPEVPARKRTLTVRRWMEAARGAYQDNHLAPKNRTGVAVVLAPSGKIYRGSRMEWSSRWFEAADLKTAAHALAIETSRGQKILHWMNQRPVVQALKALWQKIRIFVGLPAATASRKSPAIKTKIAAIAYYGDDPQLPPIASLGRMVRNGASPNTLIATVENDVLHLRTIRDFMPELYRAGE